MNYESQEEIDSVVQPGVVFTVAKMSFSRRLELMKRVREIAPRLECFQAGSTQQDKIEAGILSAEIDQLYVAWGLLEISGLQIDGRPANALSLATSGPEDLFTEALQHVRRLCRLSGPEAKN